MKVMGAVVMGLDAKGESLSLVEFYWQRQVNSLRRWMKIKLADPVAARLVGPPPELAWE